MEPTCRPGAEDGTGAEASQEVIVQLPEDKCCYTGIALFCPGFAGARNSSEDATLIGTALFWFKRTAEARVWVGFKNEY